MPILKKLIFVAFIIAFLLPVSNAGAQGGNFTLQALDDNDTGPVQMNENAAKVAVTFKGLVAGREYEVCLREDACVFGDGLGDTFKVSADADSNLQVIVCGAGEKDLKTNCGPNDYFHARQEDQVYRVTLYPTSGGENIISMAPINIVHYFPNMTLTPPNPTNSSTLKFTACGLRRPFNSNKTDSRNDYDFDLLGVQGTALDPWDPDDFTVKNNGDPANSCENMEFGPLEAGKYRLEVKDEGSDFEYYWYLITVDPSGGSITLIKDPKKFDVGGNLPEIPANFVDPEGDPGSVSTPFGPLGTTAEAFAESFLSLGIGAGGGLAFLLMIFGAYRLIFAGGNPEAIQQGRSIFTAAIAGLLVIIFAVFILNLIGIQIFGLNISTQT